MPPDEARTICAARLKQKSCSWCAHRWVSHSRLHATTRLSRPRSSEPGRGRDNRQSKTISSRSRKNRSASFTICPLGKRSDVKISANAITTWQHLPSAGRPMRPRRDLPEGLALPRALGLTLREARLVIFGKVPDGMEPSETALRGGVSVLVLLEDRFDRPPPKRKAAAGNDR